MRKLVLAMWAAAAILSCQPASRPAEVLQTSTDRDALERAAITLAHSTNSADVALLGRYLRDRAFLARLDDLSGLQTRHLAQVMRALGEHPSADVVKLCQTLAEDPVFTAEADRKSFVLELLGSVKPMSEETAAIFARSNEEGYFAFNSHLMVQNGSPRALALFESMMLDKSVEAESRVQCLHQDILPRRTDASVLGAADRILARTAEPAIATAVAEAIFDYRQNWFGIESGISGPPPWNQASAEALRTALRLADRALTRRGIGGLLQERIRRERPVIESLLASRRA